MARTQTFPARTEKNPETREKATENRCTAINGTVAPRSTLRNSPRKNMTLQQRIATFEDDKWAMNTTEDSVDCVGCGKHLKLDKRTPFNYEPFKKHKRRCRQITSGESIRSYPGGASEHVLLMNRPPKLALGMRDVNVLGEEVIIFNDADSRKILGDEMAPACTAQTWSASALEAAEMLLSLSRNIGLEA